MNKRLFFFLVTFLFTNAVYSQETNDVHPADTVHLQETIVKAFEQNRGLQETPAAINIVRQAQLNRYNNTNILPALNATPGVRMEERSPGSYRLSIRGSSLRSTFGVRNVKTYYNDIPFTDPSGNTYLNQLGFYNIQSVEIIKGPGSSLYGAGTGGVMLINSNASQWQPGLTAAYTGGSYGLNNIQAEIRVGDSGFQHTVRYQHMTSDGYRAHTNLRKDVASWDGLVKHNEKSELSAHFLFGDLYYQTPGALTLKEYQADPKAARPHAGFVPGAEESMAAVYEKTFLAGFTYKQQFSDRVQNATTLYGMYSQLHNPTTRNYARSTEPNFGGRTIFNYEFPIGSGTLDWIVGGEGQQGFTTVRTYQNRNGNPDTVQTEDEVNNQQLFGFTQLSLRAKKWIITGGLSVNRLHITYARLSNYPYYEQVRNFNNEIAPRFAVLNAITDNVSVYASVARGFSPPTTAEMSPSGGQFNFALNAEYGWNYEVGTRGYLLDRKLYFDISGFYFQLQNTIVQRRDSAGGDFYTNSGSTKQTGVESYISYQVLPGTATVGPLNIWASYTWYHFRYNHFMQLNNDFSGKDLPSVAPNTLAAGIDVNTHFGLYLNLTYYFSDKIPLDDANTAFAAQYSLLGARIGYKRNIKSCLFDIFAGGDNLLNQTYSLGNDINAFGGRYYNTAPGINFFAGLSLSYNRNYK